MIVTIHNHARQRFITNTYTKAAVMKVLRTEWNNPSRYTRGLCRSVAVQEIMIDIIWCTDTMITRLNKKYLHRMGPTDVIAFSQVEGKNPLHDPMPGILGDVCISVDTAKRQAREMRHTIKTELLLLLVHGVLHILGYEHIHNHPSAREMLKRQEAYHRFVLE